MKNSKELFAKLVDKMEIIQEDQQGQLKGGFASITSMNLTSIVPDNNCGNICHQGCKVKKIPPKQESCLLTYNQLYYI
jgi:hypothetical protein